MLKLKTIWVIVYIGGSECEFVTSDMRPVWSTKKAAKRSIESKFGKVPREYEIRKFTSVK